MYKHKGSASDLKKLARRSQTAEQRVQKVVATITIATLAAGAAYLYRDSITPQTIPTAIHKVENKTSDLWWDIKYYLAVHSAVKENAAKILNVDPKEISLSSEMSQPFKAAGLDTKFAAYNTKWIEARAGNQSVLYETGQPLEELAREKGSKNLHDYLAANLTGMGIVATLKTSPNDKGRAVLSQWGSGQSQEESEVNLSTGITEKPLAVFGGFAFSALPPDLARQNGAVSILKFDGERFVKDASYSKMTFGGDKGYYLDDENRGPGMYFEPQRTLLRCTDIKNPDSCEMAGYDGNIFNQNISNQEISGVRGIRAFLIRDKDGKDRIYPVPEGAQPNYNQLFDQLVTQEGIAGALPAQK